MELERHQKQNSSLFRSVIRLQDDDEVRQHIWVLSKMVELCQRFPVGLLLSSRPEHHLKVKIAEYYQKSPSLFCPFIELGIDTNVQKQMRGLLYPMYCNLSGIEVDPDWKPTTMLDDIFETVISDACGQFMIIEAITTYMVRNDVIPGLDVVKKLHDDGEVQSVAFSKLDKRYDVVMTSAESCLTAEQKVLRDKIFYYLLYVQSDSILAISIFWDTSPAEIRSILESYHSVLRVPASDTQLLSFGTRSLERFLLSTVVERMRDIISPNYTSQ